MLFYEHLEILKASKDRQTNMQLQASWANGSWVQVSAATLSLLVDKTVLQHLGFWSCGPDERDNIELFLKLVVRTAGKRAWSMSVYELPGKTFAGVLDNDRQEAGKALSRMRTDCETVHKAMEMRLDETCDEREAYSKFVCVALNHL